MPCILKIHVEAARGLPAMDRTSELADAYVEVRFADLEVQRTNVCRKTLNPVWREDFRFEVPDDTLLQDEPLELKVFDFDAITADDSVGTVTMDLNPLLCPDSSNQMAGWLPIYDTIRGARGELCVQAKVEFFENSNPFKESSAGIHFFSNNGIPVPYLGAKIVGLVDVIITETDPDYHWTDSFRTSRSSNEASQRILHRMSCRLRRQMGRKAMEMGGNAVLAYNQWIDIEPYAQTITFRGLGTAAIMASPAAAKEPEAQSVTRLESVSPRIELSTISKVPRGCLAATGGVVSARSVKLMSEESEYDAALTRDRWLSELRDEIYSHARNLGCNIVLGYRESVSIHEDLYVLSAEGTACRINKSKFAKAAGAAVETHKVSSADESEASQRSNPVRQRRRPRRFRECSACHLPRRHSLASQSGPGYTCNICGKATVQEILLATIEPPTDLEVLGRPLLVESHVCRFLRRKNESEQTASTVSSNLLFVEYELYRQLQFKLRYHGFNCVFGLKYQVIANDKAIVAVASGTGMCLAALPRVKALKINRNIEIRDAEDAEIFSFQERIAEASSDTQAAMQEMYSMRFPPKSSSSSSSSSEDGDGDVDGATLSSTSSSFSSSSSLSSSSSSSSSSASQGSDLEPGSKQSVVQIDDEADEDLLLTLVEPVRKSAHLSGNLDIQPDMDSLLSPKNSIRSVSHFVCLFRRFAIDAEDRHPNSALGAQFDRQYDELMAQMEGVFTGTPQVHCVRHQINLVRGVELQIVTTATVFGSVSTVVANPAELLRPIEWDDDGFSSDSEKETSEHELAPAGSGGPKTTRPASSRHEQDIDVVAQVGNVDFSTGSTVPSSVFVANCGTVTVELFKEVYYNESSGGFLGFVSSTISDLFAIARASAASLGGNALTSICFKPAAFYENFKNQLHAVVLLTGDVITVDYDHPDTWATLQRC